MTNEKAKEIYAEVWLLEKEGHTHFLADPTFMCSLLCTYQYMIMFVLVVFRFVQLQLTDVSLLLTLGLDATDRSVWGLAALGVKLDFVPFLITCFTYD